jgi:hypothetical protein
LKPKNNRANPRKVSPATVWKERRRESCSLSSTGRYPDYSL